MKNLKSRLFSALGTLIAVAMVSGPAFAAVQFEGEFAKRGANNGPSNGSSTRNDVTKLVLDHPAACSAGDLLIARVTTDGKTSGYNITGGGWTAMPKTNNPSDRVHTWKIWYKFDSGSEPNTYTISWNQSQSALGKVFCWSGVSPNFTPVVTRNRASSTAVNAPSSTAAVDGSMILRVWSADRDVLAGSAPSGHTMRGNAYSTVPGGASAGAAEILQATAGPVPAAAFGAWSGNSFGPDNCCKNGSKTAGGQWSALTIVLPPPHADLTISKTNNTDIVQAGNPVTYTIVAGNDGPDPVTDAAVNDTFAAPLMNCSWTSVASGSAGGNTPGPVVGNIAETGLSIPVGDTITYTVTCDTANPPGTDTVSNTASISSPTLPDPDSDNSSETDTDVIASDIAIIAVNKIFLDGNNETEATVAIQCSGASVTQDTVDIGHNDPFVYVIYNISGNAVCTVTEQGLSGYESSYACSGDGADDTHPCYSGANFEDPQNDACVFDAIAAGQANNQCVIYNLPEPVDVVVTKDWEVFGSEGQAVDQLTDIGIWCEGGSFEEVDMKNTDAEYYTYYTLNKRTVYFQDVEGDADLVVKFRPGFPDSECGAWETIQNSAVEVENGCIVDDDSGSGAMEISVEDGGDACTILNTVFYEGIPTLSQYGLAIMALLMLGVGFLGFRRFV